ncbi:MAG: transcription elongation factor GreA [Candidatus Pacebacteria bacterium]|nr:transcription elongation factor GreA [Candidatus Paceibacterota bacterium]MBP9851737.1 transcription elongation factor GreA [Candidatus Paceibacterota bacterium]
MGDYISKEKKVALEAELKELITVKRKEVIEAVEYAKSLGDLSENAEYHSAREAQGKLQTRIEEIEEVLRSSTVVERKGGNLVDIGATVIVQKVADKSERTLTLVGAEEADMGAGKLSHKSPLGIALMGAKVGETVSFETPAGKTEYKIISIT